jgi:hypothetical protein
LKTEDNGMVPAAETHVPTEGPSSDAPTASRKLLGDGYKLTGGPHNLRLYLFRLPEGESVAGNPALAGYAQLDLQHGVWLALKIDEPMPSQVDPAWAKSQRDRTYSNMLIDRIRARDIALYNILKLGRRNDREADDRKRTGPPVRPGALVSTGGSS